jgi:hypothetical protein
MAIMMAITAGSAYCQSERSPSVLRLSAYSESFLADNRLIGDRFIPGHLVPLAWDSKHQGGGRTEGATPVGDCLVGLGLFAFVLGWAVAIIEDGYGSSS